MLREGEVGVARQPLRARSGSSAVELPVEQREDDVVRGATRRRRPRAARLAESDLRDHRGRGRARAARSTTRVPMTSTATSEIERIRNARERRSILPGSTDDQPDEQEASDRRQQPGWPWLHRVGQQDGEYDRGDDRGSHRPARLACDRDLLGIHVRGSRAVVPCVPADRLHPSPRVGTYRRRRRSPARHATGFSRWSTCPARRCRVDAP